MAWSGKRKNTDRTSIRVTGLFKTKKPGMMIGTARPEDVEQLIEKIKEARKAEKGLTFFLFRNDRGEGPAASLLVDVEQPRREQRKDVPRKPIESDPFETDSDPDAEPDDPFADD